MSTFKMEFSVEFVTEEEAERIRDAVSGAVASIVGRVPNASSMVVPDYDGPGRTPEEAAQAQAEGRR